MLGLDGVSNVMALEIPFLQLLELPTSPAASKVFLSPTLRTVLKNGIIHGSVRPDLPSKPKFLSLLKTDVGAGKGFANVKEKCSSTGRAIAPSKVIPVQDVERTVQQARCWQVHTVAAQMRRMKEIRSKLIASAEALDAIGCGGSLLLVSGGHPARSFPLVERFLGADSFKMLAMASKLRNSGEIPAGVQLWAVENPLVNSVDRLEQKILAGAEVVIVQPPLLQGDFENWWTAAYDRGLMNHVRVVVGLPFITCAANLEFWFGLTGSAGRYADVRLAEMRRMEITDSLHVQGGSAYFEGETLRLLKFIKELPGVAGVHFMPVTQRGWMQFRNLQDQILPPVSQAGSDPFIE